MLCSICTSLEPEGELPLDDFFVQFFQTVGFCSIVGVRDREEGHSLDTLLHRDFSIFSKWCLVIAPCLYMPHSLRVVL